MYSVNKFLSEIEEKLYFLNMFLGSCDKIFFEIEVFFCVKYVKL